MADRSFRAPSPGRGSPADRSAPPVPAVPKRVPGVDAVQRRASSLEPPNRGGSPAGRGGGRGVSLDRGVVVTPARGQQRTSRLSQVLEDEHDAAMRSSVNFSRPMTPQHTPSPKTNAAGRRGRSGWFGGPVVNPEAAFRGAKPRPRTSEGLSAFEMHSAQQAVQNAADRPVTTKRSSLAHGVEGTRLASGSMRAGPSGSAVQPRLQTGAATVYQGQPRTVDPKSPFAVYDPSSRTFIHKGDAIALHKAMSEEDIQPNHEYEPQQTNAQRPYEAPQQKRVQQQPAHVDQWISGPPRKQQLHIDTHEQYQDVAPATSPQTKSSGDKEPGPPIAASRKGAVLEQQHSEDVAEADMGSAHANTSHRLDVNSAQRTEVLVEDMQSPKLASNLQGPYPRLEPPARKSASFSRSPQRANSRNNSLSPPRNAHFAPVAVEMDGAKHQPLPRSVSPGKSALKPSPSPSRRSPSPIANDGRTMSRGAPSEVSDTISDDGTKKKKLRVSFDEAPVIAGTSAYADTEPTPVRTGLGASRWNPAREEDDLDDYMKPRPVLPSFGSIRDKSRRPREEDAPEKVTETVTSSLSTSATSASEPVETSNDHRVGGILSQGFATVKDRPQSPQESLPPEVTTVEGSGYASSDSSDSDQIDDAYDELTPQAYPKLGGNTDHSRSTPQPEPKTLTNSIDSQDSVPDVPDIAVQPATPLLSETSEPPMMSPEPKVRRPSIPGGWDDDESDMEADGIKAPPPPTTSASTGPSIRFEVPPPRDIDTDSTDNDSIYSDAYEDPEDFEEAFGSINAIVDSPISKPATGLLASKHAPGLEETPSSKTPNETVGNTDVRPKVHSNDSWDAAQQHWSEVNRARKQSQTQTQQLLPSPKIVSTAKREAPVKASQSQERHIRLGSVDEVPAKKATKSAQSPAQPRKSALKKPMNPSPATSTQEPHMRKSMREGTGNASASEPRFRKSMRDGPSPASTSTEPHLRKSMRGSDPIGSNRAPSGLAASRYSMPPADPKTPRGTLQKKHLPATTAPVPASRPRPQSTSAMVPPKPTYDSDSDASASSFQRSRPRQGRKEEGRYTMRGSMRSGPAPTMRPASTMRPISPPVTASPPPSTMRRSMRPTSPAMESPANPAVRSSKFSIRSLSPGGRFRPKPSMDKAPPLPTQTFTPIKTIPTRDKKTKTPAEAPKSRFKSRFADSSDEEDEGPRPFNSRFADSDDDDDNYELPPGLAPVRGIPRRAGDEDGDSTDLEDEESDTEAAPPATKDIEKGKPPPTNGVANGQGTIGSLRDSKPAPAGLPEMAAGRKAKSKRGFFGLGKKRTPTSYLAEVEAEPHNSASADIPMPPQHRNRPLTPIGENKNIEARPASRSPKLQRRRTPQWERSTSDPWPLPPPPPSMAEDPRPMSSDGINKRAKKKKFQGLRRVFGLND
ncbi:hypothetical protein P280DRAFT_388468 [Massarina eburnea CBS 473.64]|uniref:Uncharacterized protein n=1 Tax=Massarina eburnea CBS 473.64 TaxID=1395130 RepID=A0A6A6SIM9_9PLEO|nr:hypothetical protein P280DRAFT_388468 [Massarina eburnea CBS 473.64]